MTPPPSLTVLTEAERTAAQMRFTQLRPHLQEGVPLAMLARDLGLPLRTLQRRVRQYRRDGLAGLARQRRADAGSRRLPDDLLRLIEGLALGRPMPTATAIWRRVLPVAGTNGWSVPSYGQVAAIIRHLDPGLASLAHEGSKEYRLRFDLLCRWQAAASNAAWQADHTPLDLWVHDERGQPIRPWLTVILDDYSRAVAGFRLSVTAPTALQTALTLRDAIWRKADPRWHVCGIPDVFYTDHGSDFTSRHLEQVAADLPMTLVFSEIGMPRGRGKIERFFQTVSQGCLADLPGYTPPGSRPATPGMTLAALEERLRTFLLDDYHRRPHGETGEPPQARWEAGGFLPRLPDSLEHLDLLLLTVPTSRRVQQDGIHFHGLRYLDLTLAAYVGETVTIRYDPRDMAEVRVYHRDGFLCRAIAQELAGQDVSLKELVRVRTERRRQLRADLDEHRTVVDAYLAAHRPDSPHPVPTARPPEAPRPGAPVPNAPRLKRYRNE